MFASGAASWHRPLVMLATGVLSAVLTLTATFALTSPGVASLPAAESVPSRADGRAQPENPAQLENLSGLPPPRVVVVGDSILLGARDSIQSAFSDAGFNAEVDARQNLSTGAGAQIIAGNLQAPADALVVFLGANDSANSAAFSGKVRQIVDSATGVPRIYWITTPEVRGRYSEANQVIERAAAEHPELSVLRWDLTSGADPSLTVGDGLHLKPSGVEALTQLIATNVISDFRSDALARLAEAEVRAAAEAAAAEAEAATRASGKDVSAPGRGQDNRDRETSEAAGMDSAFTQVGGIDRNIWTGFFAGVAVLSGLFIWRRRTRGISVSDKT